jgi:hypothetical protein
MWPKHPVRGRNTDPEYLKQCRARREASLARAAAKRASVAAEASDAGTPMQRLVELLGSHPSRVLANPAWELATVADPGLVSRLPAESLALVAGHPATDGAMMMVLAQEVVRRTPNYDNVHRYAAFVLATRADIPVDALRVLADHCDHRRMGAPGFEVARHRVRRYEAGDTELVDGWREALPVMMVDVAAEIHGVDGWPTWSSPLEDAIAYGGARTAHPFILGLSLRMSADCRNRVLAHVRSRGRDVNEQWLWLHASAAVVPPLEDGSHAALHFLWKMCISQWEQNFNSFGQSSRCAPSCFSEAQHRGLRNNRISSWVDAWRRDESTHETPRPVEPQLTTGLPNRCWGGTGRETTGGTHLVELALNTTDALVLRRRSYDSRWWLRAAAALNPALGDGPRDRLCRDHHWVVRAMAREAREAREADRKAREAARAAQ